MVFMIGWKTHGYHRWFENAWIVRRADLSLRLIEENLYMRLSPTPTVLRNSSSLLLDDIDNRVCLFMLAIIVCFEYAFSRVQKRNETVAAPLFKGLQAINCIPLI